MFEASEGPMPNHEREVLIQLQAISAQLAELIDLVAAIPCVAHSQKPRPRRSKKGGGR